MQRFLPLLVVVSACAGPAVVPSLDPSVTPIPEDASVRRLATGMGFTEGPVWIPEEGRLIFSDIPAARLMAWSPAGGLIEYESRPNPNGNGLDPDGRLVTCQHGARNVVRRGRDGGLEVLVSSFEGRRLNSPNDFVFADDGTLWFTDPPWGLERLTEGKEQPGHFVFRWRPGEAEPSAVVKDLCMPNGIALSLDGSHLYVADTGGHPSHPDPALRGLPATVTAYRVTREGVDASDPVWRVETVCDGMCVDPAGRIYTTAEYGVDVWTPDGDHVATLQVPEHPANVCLGGNDGQTLFITARTSLYAVELRL